MIQLMLQTQINQVLYFKVLPLPEKIEFYTAFNASLGQEMVNRYQNSLAKAGGVTRYQEYLDDYIQKLGL